MKTDDSCPTIALDLRGTLWIHDGIGHVRVRKKEDLIYARPFQIRSTDRPVTIDEAQAILIARNL